MNNSVQNGNNLVIEAYVDGSYNSRTNEFSYGMIVLQNGEELKFAEKYNDKELAFARYLSEQNIPIRYGKK